MFQKAWGKGFSGWQELPERDREADAQSYGDECLGTEGSSGSPGIFAVPGRSRDKTHGVLFFSRQIPVARL